MASSKPTDQSQAKKKDDEKDKPVVNGLKKDETEELVDTPPELDTQTNNPKSEADQNLKNELETLVERLKVVRLALRNKRLTWE
jgi:hypothetical protein